MTKYHARLGNNAKHAEGRVAQTETQYRDSLALANMERAGPTATGNTKTRKDEDENGTRQERGLERQQRLHHILLLSDDDDSQQQGKRA